MPLRLYTHDGTAFPPESHSEEDLNPPEKLFSGPGYSIYSLEEDVLRIHTPAGLSLKDVLHCAQQPLDEGYRDFSRPKYNYASNCQWRKCHDELFHLFTR